MIAASFSYFLELLLQKNKFQFKKCRKISFIKELIKLSDLNCSCRKVVEKSNEENQKVIKNTFPNKSGNPGSLKKKKKKKKSEQLESCSTNVHILGEDLFWKLFSLRF